MIMFRDFHDPENLFNLAILLLIPTINTWLKSAKATVINLLKYHCAIIAESHKFYFQVTLEIDFKQNTGIDEG